MIDALFDALGVTPTADLTGIAVAVLGALLVNLVTISLDFVLRSLDHIIPKKGG